MKDENKYKQLLKKSSTEIKRAIKIIDHSPNNLLYIAFDILDELVKEIDNTID